MCAVLFCADTMFRQLTKIAALISSTLVLMVAGSESEVETSAWQPSYVVSLVSACSIVCIVVMIVACMKWCRNETEEFKVLS